MHQCFSEKDIGPMRTMKLSKKPTEGSPLSYFLKAGVQHTLRRGMFKISRFLWDKKCLERIAVGKQNT